jgi:hypothetical protein
VQGLILVLAGLVLLDPSLTVRLVAAAVGGVGAAAVLAPVPARVRLAAAPRPASLPGPVVRAQPRAARAP